MKTVELWNHSLWWNHSYHGGGGQISTTLPRLGNQLIYSLYLITFSTHTIYLNRSPDRTESRGSWKSKTTYFGVKLPGISTLTSQSKTLPRFAATRSAPPGGATKMACQHAVRRHMQNEEKKDFPNYNNCFPSSGAKTEDVPTW